MNTSLSVVTRSNITEITKVFPTACRGGKEKGLAQSKVIKVPEHGRLEHEEDSEVYNYVPNKGFEGDDHFVISASFTGSDWVTIYYTYKVHRPTNPEFNTEGDYCDGKNYWKISNVPTPNDIQTTINFAHSIDAAIALAFIGFSGLPGTTLGQTIGTRVSAKSTLAPGSAKVI